MHYEYLLIPLISSLIGALLTCLAGKFFFKTIPRYWPSFAKKIALVIQKQLQSKETAQEIVETINLEESVNPMLETRMDGFIDTVKAKNPAIGLFVGPPLINSLKVVARDEFKKAIPDLTHLVSTQLQSPQLAQIFENRVNQFDIHPFLPLLWRRIAPHLLLGGALVGLAIGLIQLILFILLFKN